MLCLIQYAYVLHPARLARSILAEAKHTGGTFVVRIEDTDQKRSTRESEENIKEALRWLGINWDEGIDVGGPDGPYRQMERLDIYKKYTDKLLAEGKAYYCVPICRRNRCSST